jgi:hypothetical protein
LSALVRREGTPDVLNRQQQDRQHPKDVELGELLGPPEVRRVPLECLLSHDQKTRHGEKTGCERSRKASCFSSSDPQRSDTADREGGKKPTWEIGEGEQSSADGGQHRCAT